MPSNLPVPLIPVSQWVHGEQLDDLKLHQRIDVPLDTLGDSARAWGVDFASFAGTCNPAVPVSGSAGTPGAAPIPYLARIDTHEGWGADTSNPNTYQPQVAGLYLISAQFATTSATATFGLFLGDAANTADPPYRSPMCDPVAGGGCSVSVVRRLNSGQRIYAQHTTGSLTPLSGDSCWLFVQQLAY